MIQWISSTSWKGILKISYLTHQSRKGALKICSCSLSQRWRFQRVCSKVLGGIESDLAYTSIGVLSHYMLRSVSLWQPLRHSMLKNNGIFSLVVLKIYLFSLYDCTTWCRQQSYKLIHHQRITREVRKESLYRLAH